MAPTRTTANVSGARIALLAAAVALGVVMVIMWGAMPNNTTSRQSDTDGGVLQQSASGNLVGTVESKVAAQVDESSSQKGVPCEPVPCTAVPCGVNEDAQPAASLQVAAQPQEQPFGGPECTPAAIALMLLETAEEAEKTWKKDKPEWHAFQLDQKKSGGPVLVPQMAVNHWRTLVDYASKATTYLEYGSGGSTELVAPFAKRAYTVEHYEPWCRYLTQRPIGRCMSQSGRHKFRCVNTGIKLCKWGAPCSLDRSDKAHVDAWYKYVDAMDNLPDKVFDVVFSDGRARVAVGVKALAYMHENSILMIHDYNRKEYKKILKYFHKVTIVVGRLRSIKKLELGVFRPKKEYLGNTDAYREFETEWM